MFEVGSTLDCGTSFASNAYSIIFGWKGNFADLLKICTIFKRTFHVLSRSYNVGVVLDGGRTNKVIMSFAVSCK